MSSTLKVLTLLGIIVLLNGALKAEDSEVNGDDYDDVDYEAPPIISPRSYGLNVELGGKQYYVGSYQQVNWYRAAQICALRNMALTAIESAEEYNQLYFHLIANSMQADKFWTSGNDLALAGRHVWLATGQKFNYTKWTSTTAPTTVSPGCVLSDATFQWDTASCDDKHYFICSRSAMPYCGANGRCIYAYNY